MIDHILKKWPEAELRVQSSMAFHDNELIITNANKWFITMSHSSGKVSAIIYMITGSVKNNNLGYQYLKEYRVNILQKQEKYRTSYIRHLGISRFVKMSWSMAELIRNMELEMAKSTAETIKNETNSQYYGLRPII